MKNELYLYPGVTPEQLEALKDEVRDFIVLGTQDIKNNKLEFSDEEKVLVRKGTLLHGTTYSDNENEKIESIALNGIITNEFFGCEETGSTNYHVEYYKANKDMALSEFVSDGRSFFPKNDNFIIGFMVVPGSDLVEFLKSDSLAPESNVTEEIRNLAEKGKISHEQEILEDKIAAIPIGIPVNCISAIIVGNNISTNKDKMYKLHNLFSKCYIVSINGDVIEKPED